MIRLGSAFFNADHTRLGDELRRTEQAGVDFFHLDVFDGYAVSGQAFSARTIQSLRPMTKLPFEVHLSAKEPGRFIESLADAGVELLFLPAEHTPMLYESIYAVGERKMRPGVSLALGTPLEVVRAVLPMVTSVLLLGRVTGEGSRGRDFNRLLIDRVRQVRRWIDDMGLKVDLQAAGGLETDSCREVVAAGATSLPIGAALHREPDMTAYVAHLRSVVSAPPSSTVPSQGPWSSSSAGPSASSPHAPVSSFNVLVASRSFGKNCPDVLEKMKAMGCVFMDVSWDKAPTEKQLIDAIADADVLVSGTEPVSVNVLAAAKRLKVITKHGVGYENIDLAAAKAKGIPVCIAGGAISDAVADMAMALLLASARRIAAGDRGVRAGTWPRYVGPELPGKTLGIVGLGQIGKAVTRRARGFGMHVLAYDAFEDAAFAASWGVRYVDLETLLAESDFVSLHAPVTPETRGMIDAARLALMKPTAYLINTARGELVDENALAAALSSGKLAGAASDVFCKEPPPPDHPLLQCDTFTAAPHLAGQTHEGLRKMGEVTAENALRVLRGESPLFRVA